MIDALLDKVLGGGMVSRDEALSLTALHEAKRWDLFAAANNIRAHFRGDGIDLCAIVNAKSGSCPEDCSYCAQASRSSASVSSYPLMDTGAVLLKAEEALKGGARRFCIVTSGRKAAPAELDRIAEMVGRVRKMGLLPCSTLGLLHKEELQALKDAGLERYHHNLETSEAFFPEICTTHTYQDKLRTIADVKGLGLSLCSGGIFGLGEGWEDRIDMALALREIGPDSVPINFLTPIAGTRLGSRPPLEPLEALTIISLYRFILPDTEIRVCGGRVQALGQLNAFVFFAGADGLLTGNYLTTTGRQFGDDLELIRDCGLKTVEKEGGHA